MRTTSWKLFNLAPGGVYTNLKFVLDLVVSYTTISPLPEGGIFSAALSIIWLFKYLPVRKHLVAITPERKVRAPQNKVLPNRKIFEYSNNGKCSRKNTAFG